MKKIFYWSPCLNKVGTYRSTINSALSVSKYSNNNFSVKIINACGEWDDKKELFKKNNIEIINLGLKFFKFLPKIGFINSRLSNIIIFVMSFFFLARLLKKEKPDYLIAHLITSLPLTLMNLFNLKTRFILRISGFPRLNILRKFFWKFSAKKIFRVTCPSKELKKQLIKLNFLDESKLIFLPDPIIHLKEFIDNLKFSRNRLSKLNKREYFISVGRLTKQKNFEYLIDEFNLFSKKNKNIDLYIFGEGEKKNLLLKKIIDYGLSGRVFLKGYSEDIYFHMKNSKAFILSSLWEDPGFVIIEAALCNLLVISSDCKNGPEEFLNNGKAGILFKSNSKNALFDSLIKFLNSDEKFYEMKTLAKKNSSQYTLFKHYGILKSILSGN